MSIFNQWDEQRYAPDAFAGFTSTSDLDLANARALMWASQLAYELDIRTSQRSVDKVKRILQTWRMQLVGTVPVPGFPANAVRLFPLLSTISRDALVISGHGAIIVAFAGTDPPRPQDWLVNFAALASATGVSEGLHDAAGVFVPGLKVLLDQNKGLKLFVTGHSLGGSLGVAVADALDQVGCKADAIYTFGMPRAGDPVFAARYDQSLGQRTFRFVHGDDLVPTVPPASGIVRHQHVGWLIQCETGGKFAASQRSADTSSNEPVRGSAEIVADLTEPGTLIERGVSAFRTFFVARDPVETAIASLPPRVRHHLQDQYIAALTS
jgi:triacylglycerol lipase